MIKKISEWIDTQLALAGLVEKFFPLVETISDGDKRYPAHYKGAGQYETVSNFDGYNNMAYLRLNGNPTAINLDSELAVCSLGFLFSYPVRLVFCIRRESLKVDDAFSEEALVQELIRLISTKGGALKTSTKAASVLMVPESWTTDGLAVVSQEYEGTQMQDINYKFIYGAINFVCTIGIKKECLPSICETEVCYG